VFPLEQIAHVRVSPRISLKQFGRGEIIFEEFQPMWSRHLNVTDGRPDGQTDGQTTYCGITAHCVASRGKNRSQAYQGSSLFLPWYSNSLVMKVSDILNSAVHMCIGDYSSLRLHGSNARYRRVSDAWYWYSVGVDQRCSIIQNLSSTQLPLHLLASCALRLLDDNRNRHLYLYSCMFCYFLLGN